MSKTLRTYKGQEYRQRKERKKLQNKKFFGFTSGQHSRGVYERAIIDCKIEYTKTDRAPIKGEDFIKYGWPCDVRKKKMREY